MRPPAPWIVVTEDRAAQDVERFAAGRAINAHLKLQLAMVGDLDRLVLASTFLKIPRALTLKADLDMGVFTICL